MGLRDATLPDLFAGDYILDLAARTTTSVGAVRSTSSSGSSTLTRAMRHRFAHDRPRHHRERSAASPPDAPRARRRARPDAVRPGRGRPATGSTPPGCGSWPRRCRRSRGTWAASCTATCSSTPPTPPSSPGPTTGGSASTCRTPSSLRPSSGVALLGGRRPPGPPHRAPASRRRAWASTARGVQVGDGEVDWPVLAAPARRPRPRRGLHPRDLAGPRQRRRGVLDRRSSGSSSGSEHGPPYRPAHGRVGRPGRGARRGWAGTSSTSPGTAYRAGGSSSSVPARTRWPTGCASWEPRSSPPRRPGAGFARRCAAVRHVVRTMRPGGPPQPPRVCRCRRHRRHRRLRTSHWSAPSTASPGATGSTTTVPHGRPPWAWSTGPGCAGPTPSSR